MPKITVVIDVQPRHGMGGEPIDPTRTDSYEIADWMVEDHHDTLIANGESYGISFVSAEWND